MTQQTEKLTFILGLDHRLDFCRELIGSGDTPSAEDRRRAADLKRVVFDGLARSIEEGLPKSVAVVWADHDLGESVLLRARALSLPIAVSIERPGAGPGGMSTESTATAWAAVVRLDARYAAVRLAYNFADEAGLKKSLQEQLRTLSTKCKEAAKGLIVELTPQPTPEQLSEAGGKVTAALRAQLLIEAMKELQDASVEASLWVLGAPADRQAAATASAQAYVDDRTGVEVAFEVAAEPDPGKASQGLSRADRAMARLAARTTGVTGLLAGPDVYFGTLARLQQGQVEREAAVAEISVSLRKLWEVFTEARRTSDVT
jgi:myo-inositol catabolism protein IolC